MADTAYHMEALRRQRVLERKAEASKRIEDAVGQTGNPAEVAKELRQSQLVFSEPGQYARNRNTLSVKQFGSRPCSTFCQVQIDGKGCQQTPPADKELISRIRHRQCRAENEGEDRVMPLLHPPEYNFIVPMDRLPPRKPHFKV